MTRSFYVYSPETCCTRYRHATLESAKLEASRLAKERPGQHFEVLALVGAYRYVG
jgi:hypothetical protein